LNEILRQAIPTLAKLYDEFTYSLDPHSPECDESERQFYAEFANLHDCLRSQFPDVAVCQDKHALLRHVISLCKKHLRQDRPPEEKKARDATRRLSNPGGMD